MTADPANRTTRAIYAVVFVVLLAIDPALWLSIGSVQTPGTPPMPEIGELGVMDGRYADGAMRHFTESSGVTVGVRALRHEVDHLAGLFETDRVRLGVGGTMFAPVPETRSAERRVRVLQRIPRGGRETRSSDDRRAGAGQATAVSGVDAFGGRCQ